MSNPHSPKQLVIEHGPFQLRAELTWREDRFTHQIDVAEAGANPDAECWVPVFRSIDGTYEDKCPPSPAFQEIEIHEHAGSSLLGVGMAGTLYWSASIDPLPNGIRVDIACRLKEPFELGSQYERILNGNLDPASMPESARLRNLVQLTADSDNCEILQTTPNIVIRPLESPTQFPTTVRWSYRFLIISDA